MNESQIGNRALSHTTSLISVVTSTTHILTRETFLITLDIYWTLFCNVFGLAFHKYCIWGEGEFKYIKIKVMAKWASVMCEGHKVIIAWMLVCTWIKKLD